MKYRTILSGHQPNLHKVINRCTNGKPVASALIGKMEYTENEKIAVIKEFLRMLVRLELDPARSHELTTFFETLFKTYGRRRYIAGRGKAFKSR